MKCDGWDYYGESNVIEQYEYDKKSKLLSVEKKAVERGEDVTDMMQNEHYVIDCGDDTLAFQLHLKDRFK